MFRSYSYQFYELAHAALVPARAVSDAAHFVFRNPWNPLSSTAVGRNISAGAELFERMTRRYGKPTFGLDEIEVDGTGLLIRSPSAADLCPFSGKQMAGGTAYPHATTRHDRNFSLQSHIADLSGSTSIGFHLNHAFLAWLCTLEAV